LKVAAEWSFADVPITALAVMPPTLGGNIGAPHKLLWHASSKNIAHRRKRGKRIANEDWIFCGGWGKMKTVAASI